MPKDNKKNKHYSKEFKEAILKRLEPPINDTIINLSKEFGVPRTTIYQWVKKNNKVPVKQKSPNKWTSEDKFYIILETAALTEEELAEYCRRKGIYVDQIKSWREQCLKANVSNLEDSKKLKEELKEEKDKNKKLKKELQRKEKALAETAALLVLRKKANAIWGDPEDE